LTRRAVIEKRNRFWHLLLDIGAARHRGAGVPRDGTMETVREHPHFHPSQASPCHPWQPPARGEAGGVLHYNALRNRTTPVSGRTTHRHAPYRNTRAGLRHGIRAGARTTCPQYLWLFILT
jgi:hypothetical protein